MRSMAAITAHSIGRAWRRSGLAALVLAAGLSIGSAAHGFAQPNDSCDRATPLDFRRGESTLDATDAVRLGVMRASSSRDATTDVKVGRSLCVSLPETGPAWGAVAPGRGRRGQISADRRFVRCVPCGRWAGPSPVCAMSDNLALCERGRL